MSKFVTTIPVQIQEVIDLFPKGSFVHGVVLRGDRTAVDVVWDCDSLKTAYTFPLPYPVEKLRESVEKKEESLGELLERKERRKKNEKQAE